MNKIPHTTSPDRATQLLGYWVKDQRSDFREGKLSPERIRLLEAIPGWFWEKERWLNSYKRYKTSDPVVDKKWRIEWRTLQRVTYRMGELSAERIRLLEEIDGWSWDVDRCKDEIWLKHRNDLKAYMDEHGKTPSIKLDSGALRSLAMWAVQQKTFNRRGTLSAERIRLLEEIDGWVWKDDKEERWITRLNELNEFLKEHRKFPSRKSKDKAVRSLGHWVKMQKTNYKEGTLSAERIRLLEEISMWYWTGWS